MLYKMRESVAEKKKIKKQRRFKVNVFVTINSNIAFESSNPSRG